MNRFYFIIAFILIALKSFSQTNTFPESGNVGIGTLEPSQKFEIISGQNDGTNPPIFRLTSKDVNAIPNQLLGEIQFYNMDADGTHISSFIRGLAAETYGRKGQIVFGTSGTNSTDAIERMRIDENGNLGIGTTLPQSIFNIKNNTSQGSVITLEKYTSNSLIGGIRFTAGYDNYEDWSGIEAYGTGGLDQQDLRFYTSFGTRLERMRITQHGSVGIGTQNTFGYKLAVNGTIGAKEVNVEVSSDWPDFVFYDNYNLKDLNEVERFVNKHKHLPEMPKASEVEENGINVGEMNVKLLQKIEELTLYAIQQQKEIQALKEQNLLVKKQEKEIDELKSLVKELLKSLK